jgi:hypothetical protein
MAVTVDNTDDLTRAPGAAVTPDTLPNDLDITDLVIGGGAEAGPRDTVQVQYQGIRVSDSGECDSSWGDVARRPPTRRGSWPLSPPTPPSLSRSSKSSG